MYNQVFGGCEPELVSEFERHSEFEFEEFESYLTEAPIERPYEFC